MKNAFSLLELSIVLVIIGLIAGGVVSGSNMIRAAEIRAITSEANQFQTAIYTFRDKYFGLPGDINNATAFWGTGATCPSDTTGGTCNGDKNGVISGSTESGYAWQHLSLAELISGSMSGMTPGTTTYWEGGENCPASKVSGVDWNWIAQYTPYNTSLPSKHYLLAGTASPLHGPFLTPAEARSLDMKVDDGNASRGSVIGTASSGSMACVSGSPSNYTLSEDDKTCLLWFRHSQ